MGREIHQLKAGIIGTGFIGPVHLEGLRRLGVEVVALCGSDKASGVARRLGIPRAFTGYDHEAMCREADIDVVHITSPNRQHFEQSMAALQAGKHVVCEKPLAVTSRESAALVKAVARSRSIFAVNYNIRFYPAVLQLRADVAKGRLGEILHVNGSYFQDWLLKPTDYNWRLLPEEGGKLRGVADIGTHWMDTASFILGRRIDRVFAHLETCHKTRFRPVGEVQTFVKSTGRERTVPYRVRTEDFASLLLRFQGGVHGNLGVSQVAAGRKNSLRLELYGSRESAWWDSEEPNIIHYGSRDGTNRLSHRQCPGFSEDVAGFTDYPPGHAEGFPDSFKMLYRAVYQDILSGRSANPLYATAQDGHHEVKVCEAVLRSHRDGRWVAI
ncbi:MAG TPA: gfo/Idh/MocA family oxidoreductase [Verrucomicrobiales bacterium]|nr:gfo/Idh/MocA family oxidoreductase [Verrucomicrobiales bacterium]